MNWLSKLTPPGVKDIFSKKDSPDNLWMKCPKSGEMVFSADLAGLLHVTPAGHHLRIGPEMRMDYTFDDAAYTEVAIPEVAKDPLKFKDDQKYTDRLKKARAKTLIVFTAAGGARMQEGALSLMQMPRTTIAVQELREAGLPYIVVLCDPTTGGVTASYAMLGDIHLAEPGALICFAGPRVIEETIREKLPEGFQRAEFLEEKGMIDRVVPRRDMRKTLGKLLSVLMKTPIDHMLEDA